VEPRAGQLIGPKGELLHDDVGQVGAVATEQGGHRGTRLQGRDLETPRGERSRGAAGAGANLKGAILRQKASELHHPVEDGCWIPGPVPVVEVGDLT
jgi:hypothetical protein